jgi:xeroderma pigmentosum group C-complementing protein
MCGYPRYAAIILLVLLAMPGSRFHWPSQISCSIATTILEDYGFIDSFLQQSLKLLRSYRDFAVRILDEAGIPYARGWLVIA